MHNSKTHYILVCLGKKVRTYIDYIEYIALISHREESGSRAYTRTVMYGYIQICRYLLNIYNLLLCIHEKHQSVTLWAAFPLPHLKTHVAHLLLVVHRRRHFERVLRLVHRSSFTWWSYEFVFVYSLPYICGSSVKMDYARVGSLLSNESSY